MTVVVSVVGLVLDGQPASDLSVTQQTQRCWHIQLREGSTVEHVMSRLNLPAGEVDLVLVNGVHADCHTMLSDGDAIAFAGMTGD